MHERGQADGRLTMPGGGAAASRAHGAGASVGDTVPRSPSVPVGDGRRVVFIGASTGGTEAIKAVLQHLPAGMPPILIVQHMPEMFTQAFAARLDKLCALNVKEAEEGDVVKRGWVYVAPGHSHLSLRRVAQGAGAGGSVGIGVGLGLQCVLSRSEPVNRHRPSVDVLFQSAAQHLGAAAVGVLLTGMGKDGAEGLLTMRRAGAWTIAQDQDSSVVYGMPRAAVAIDAVDEVLALKDIASCLQRRVGVGA